MFRMKFQKEFHLISGKSKLDDDAVDDIVDDDDADQVEQLARCKMTDW